MKFEWTVKFGDILTSVTILISVTALIISWSKDRITRETEQADVVRSAAAQALTSIDRWRLLNLALYKKLQPTFVDVSEGLSERFDVIEARDSLWKEINSRRAEISEAVLDEKILTSYVLLLSHFPETRNQFITLFQELDRLEEQISFAFLRRSQEDVLSFEGRDAEYTSAMLGNALRTTAESFEDRFRKETSEAISPAKEFLLDVIGKSNKELLKVSRGS